MDPGTAKSILEVLLHNCKQYKDKTALHWLDRDGEIVEKFTYREIEQRTRMIARGLLELLQMYKLLDKPAKHCAVLCYPPGLEFILTFIACLRAGIIAVPVCPPSKRHSAYTTDTLNKIITDSGAVVGFTNKEFCDEPTIAKLMGTSSIPWHCELILDTDEENSTIPSEREEGEMEDCSLLDKSDPKEVILLQYTSGSTGDPKGVMNTNEGVLHNLELTKTITRTSDRMIEVSFLPHYHDFGLFCSYLQTLYCGATGYFTSPTSFIENPGCWISCLSKYKATHTQAPNFAFELVLRKGYPTDVDLTSLSYIANGSEPVYPDTIMRFEKALAPLGLQKNTIRVAYGLAEHTVYMSGVMGKEDPLVIKGRISCGKPALGIDVKVVDPETKKELSEDEEGEIWVDSGSKALGYWRKINETHTTFEAELSQNSGRVYLRTGDLGFKSHGELFISGRIKDLIVMYGRKIHPSDIEMRVESQFDILRPGRSVACEYELDSESTETNKRGVAYVAELRSANVNHLAELQTYSMQIAAHISMDFQVQTKLVVLIGPGAMPRTTSGKRQRSLCKYKLLNNTLPEEFRWSPFQSSSPATNDLSPFVFQTTQSSQKDDTQSEDEPLKAFNTASLLEVSPSTDARHISTKAFEDVSRIRKRSSSSSDRRQSTPSFDIARQFNFEMGKVGDCGDLVKDRRPSIIPPFPHSPVFDVESFTVPVIIAPDTSSPLRKARRESTVVPAITVPNPKQTPIPSKLPQIPRLSNDNPGLLLGIPQDTVPRRNSAPPHEVDFEENRILDELRRPSMKDRKVILRRRERRNSIQTLTATISRVLGTKIGPDSNIWAYGCNSVKAVQLSRSLQLDFGFSVEPHLLFTHQTPVSLMENLQRKLLNMPNIPHLNKENRRNSTDKVWKTQSLDRMQIKRKSSFGLVTEMRRMSLPKITSDDGGSSAGSSSVRSSSCSFVSETAEPELGSDCSEESSDIAIVGMACSFAGCENPEELWELLLGKQVATGSYRDPLTNETFRGGFTTATGIFDHDFFGVSQWEASTMDPQQSILLHTAWECLQNGGYANSEQALKEIRGSDWGVYVGISLDCDAHFLSSTQSTTPPATSISSSIAANRIARTFDLVGPTVTIDTACASSLSALDAACLSIRTGNCPAALVCGVNALLDKHRFKLLENMGMLAPDEKCKVFDKEANGYVRGEGCGAVLLMPLFKAKKEARRILAVVKATATNNNGAASSTLTSPHTGTQMKLLNKALSKSKIDPVNVRYVEAHGTGTKLGDPIEVDAIQGVLGVKHSTTANQPTHKTPKQDHPVFLGSVKANIGHLETGAGIAGLIKTILVLEHAEVPGNPCLTKLNPAFRLSHNIQIPTDNIRVQRAMETKKMCAIVNSFGFGGTNATAVLQQFGILPHMVGVKCGLLLGTDQSLPIPATLTKGGSTSGHTPTITKAISTLRKTFPVFQKAIEVCENSINTGYQQARGRRGSQSSEIMATFQLLYGLSCLLTSLGIETNIVGSTDILGEILALNIAGAIEVPHAIYLASCCEKESCPSVQEFQSSLWKPFIPVFSSILGKVCSPSQYETELGSERYAHQFLSKLKSTDTHGSYIHTKAVIVMSSQSIDTYPLLTLRMDQGPRTLSEIEQNLPNVKVMMSMSSFVREDVEDGIGNDITLTQYLRQKCMELRKLNDKLMLSGCMKKPSKNAENMLPGFYQRYPLRVLVDEKQSLSKEENKELEGSKMPPLESTKDDGIPRKSSTISESGSKDVINESGYLTQTASTESVQTTTPTSTQMKAPPPSPSSLGIKLGMKLEGKGGISESCIKALWKEEAIISENWEPEDSRPSSKDIREEQKKEVLSAILKQVEDELDDTDMPLDEVASSGIYELGLDSLNVMQMADFFKKSYNVHFTFSELVELETLGEVAEAVVQQSSTLQQAATQRTDSQSKEKCTPPEQTLFPTLTKDDYYMAPSLEDLQLMIKEDPTKKLSITDFTVGRKGHGKIVFVGETDITGLNLDKLVSIEQQEVVLSKDSPRPERNTLNKPALVCFEGIYPGEDTQEHAMTLKKGLEEYCNTTNKNIPTKFVSYDPQTGLFVLKVDRFY